MANSRQIKRRISSAHNIAKITKAMEMVSASKMRRAQQQANASRPYSDRLIASLRKVTKLTDPSLHPLLQDQPSGQDLLVIIATDRGLCGGLNTNLFKSLADYAANKSNFTTMVIGKKALEFVRRMDWPLTASFTDLPEQLSFQDILPWTEIIIEGFLGDDFSSVTLIYNEFISTLSQQPKNLPLLPFSYLDLEATDEVEEKVATTVRNTTELFFPPKNEYIFEPSAKEILNDLLPAFIETMIFQLALEAKASEHSARMIAMQNASNNAKEVVESLQLEYNKTRQAAITTELIEITTASLAIGT